MYYKYCIRYCLENAPEEMKFFNEMIDKTLLERLNHVLNTPFKTLEYTSKSNIPFPVNIPSPKLS